MTIFDRACFEEKINIDEHKPDERNQDGYTIAMI